MSCSDAVLDKHLLAFWSIELVLGLVIVLAAAAMRFNRPSWYRTYTTAPRFYMMLIVYAFFQALVYYVLCSIALRVGVCSKSLEHMLNLGLFSPVSLAIVTAWLLPLIPGFERWPRQALQRLAGIPSEAVRLAQGLSRVCFTPDSSVQAEVNSILLRRGVPLEHWLPPAAPAQNLFLKTAVVFYQLRAWDASGRYKRFMHETRDEYDRLRQRFDELSLKVSRTLANIERLGEILIAHPGARGRTRPPADEEAATGEAELDVQDAFRKVIGDIIDDLLEEISFLFRSVCLFLARGVLSCEVRSASRLARLREFGFVMEEERPATGWVSAAVYASAILLAGSGAYFQFVATRANQPAEVAAPILSLLVTLVQIGALAVAIIPKSLWGFANAGISGRTPIAFVLAAGAAGAVISLIANMLLGSLMHEGGWTGALQRLSTAYPYMLVSAATASTTAWLIQDHRWSNIKSSLRRRLLDGLVLGAVMCGTSLLVDLWFVRFPSSAAPASADLLGGSLTALIIGSLLGFVVPASFRRSWASGPLHWFGWSQTLSISKYFAGQFAEAPRSGEALHG